MAQTELFSLPEWSIAIGVLLGCWRKQMPSPAHFCLSVSEQKQGLSLWGPLLAASSVMLLLPNKSWGGCFRVYDSLSRFRSLPTPVTPSLPNPLKCAFPECILYGCFPLLVQLSSFFLNQSIEGPCRGEKLLCPSEYLTVGSGEGCRPPSVLPFINVSGSNVVPPPYYFFFTKIAKKF